MSTVAALVIWPVCFAVTAVAAAAAAVCSTCSSSCPCFWSVLVLFGVERLLVSFLVVFLVLQVKTFLRKTGAMAGQPWRIFTHLPTGEKHKSLRSARAAGYTDPDP